MDGYSQMYQHTQDFMETAHAPYSQNFEFFQNTANDVMGMLGERDRLYYQSHLTTQPVHFGQDETVPQSLRRRGGRRGRRRGEAGTSNVQQEHGHESVGYGQTTMGGGQSVAEAGPSNVQQVFHNSFGDYEPQMDPDAHQLQGSPNMSFLFGGQHEYQTNPGMMPQFHQDQSQDFYQPIPANETPRFSNADLLDLNLFTSPQPDSTQHPQNRGPSRWGSPFD
jgi:hypothetical protein